MNKRTVRAVVAAAVLIGVVGFFDGVVTGTADAAADPIGVPAPPGHRTTDFTSINDIVVDPVHRHVLVSDPSAGRLVALNYDGTTAAQVGDLPGADGIVLSADSGTVYVAVRDKVEIVALRADTLAEIDSYRLQDAPSRLALIGSRLWYTVTGSNFGVLDLNSGNARLHDHGDYNPWSGGGALLIAASPTDPDLVAVSAGPGITSGPVALYDVSGDTEERIASTGLFPFDDVINFRGLEFSADGSRLAVGGANGIGFLSAENLSGAGTIEMNGSIDLDVASNGWLATGKAYTAGFAHLLLVPGGSTTVAREVYLPTDSFSGGLAGLAWEPGGDRLVAITSSVLGEESLWVIDSPTKTETAIRLSAPASATRGAALTVTGTISGSLPPGSVLSVRRTDLESPNGVALAPVVTGANGAFSFTDHPPAGGTVTYTVSYAGDGDHKASSASARVAVSQAMPALTLTPNGTVNAYGATVTLTAHLGTTFRNRTVAIWANPYGSDQGNRQLKTATVNSSGNVTVSLKPTRNTTVSAVFAGDSRYAPRTVTALLKTKVSAATTVAKAYRTAKIGSTTYYHVRKSVNPVFTTTMTYHPGRTQMLSFEYYSGGRWRQWRDYKRALNSAGKSTYTLTGTHKTGVRYRVRAAYLPGTSGDSLNHPTYGGWKYFTFTK
ncbi:hypothetical protein [Actinoplanes sp. NPDC049118]|uniref:hypothetical protein n=1 Tax=Actinoplanes sp. NPDC049118 TaxID=3155769 RepID=UPI00340CEB8E